MKKSKKITAAILSSAILIFTAGCSGGSDNLDFGEPTDHYTQETEELPQIVYGEPAIGGNSILSQDTQGDLTATLELLKITGLPDGSEENNYYCGQYLVVRIKDGKSGISAANTLPENDSLSFKNETFTADGKMRISADCSADSIELLTVEDKGKTECVLKVEYVQGPDRRIAAFASCDMSKYGENGGGRLKWYEIVYYGNTDNACGECMVSEDFTYKGGNKFADGHLEKVYEFDTQALRVNISSMEDSDIVFDEPEIGKHSILSQCTLGDYHAAVEIHNIVSMPQDNSYGCYCGESLFVKLCVKDRIIARGYVPNGFVGGGDIWINSVGIHKECTGEGATRIFEVEQKGKTHYILMQYSFYYEETDVIEAAFACFDPEFYDEYMEEEQGYGEVHSPKWYSFSGTWGVRIPVSEEFEYVGDGIFRDSFYGYEIEVDCENYSGEVRSIQE